jgi:DNA-binding transcriptional MerR regulator
MADWGPLIEPLDEDALLDLIKALVDGLKRKREALVKGGEKAGVAIDVIDRMISELEAASALDGVRAKKTAVKHALAIGDSIVAAIDFLKTAIPLNPLSKYRFLVFLLKLALKQTKDKKKKAKLEELLKKLEELEKQRAEAEKNGDKQEQEKAEKAIDETQKEIEKEV